MNAYAEGFRAGWADKLNGWTSRYCSVSFSGEPVYVQEYSRGYLEGQYAATVR